MAASVIVLWLLAAFLGRAFSLTCYQCNTTATNCEENEKPCLGTHDTCITTLTEIHQDKTSQQKPYKQLVKSCGEKQQCNQMYSMSFNTTKLYASVTCCDSDKCKTSFPEVKIQDKDKENKVQCPYCGGLNAKCSDMPKVNCFGKEDKCVSFKSKDAANPSTTNLWSGCATKNVCDMNTVATLPMNHILATPFQCNRAPSLLPGPLLATAFGLALMKLLL